MVITTVLQLNPIEARKRLSIMIKSILSRPQAYANGVDVVADVRVLGDGRITGIAIGRDRRQIEFTINLNQDKVEYKLISPRLDTNWREDTNRKQAKCATGLPCKGACIDPRKSCPVPASKLASPPELRQLKAVANQVAGVVEPTTQSEAPDDLDSKTIRELQAIAREQGVYRYNHLTKDKLIGVLRELKKDPQSQEHLRKTLEKRSASRSAIKGIVGKELLGKTALDLWNKTAKILQVGKINPDMAGLAVAAVLLDVSRTVVLTAKERYKDGLPESAVTAMQRAKNLPVEDTDKDNLLFAVGGLSGTGSTGENLKRLIENPQSDTPEEKWFNSANKVIPFDSKEYDTTAPFASPKNADGSDNLMYTAQVAQQGLGKFVKNIARGKNDAAIDLAAQIYAHAERYPDKPINILAHGVGGNITNEAVEILSLMKPREAKGATGKSIAERLNIVSLGTADPGFTDDPVWKRINNRTITSQKDPFSVLPKKSAQWVSSVPGHAPSDYLNNPDTRERLRDAFGYHESGAVNRKENEQKQKEAERTYRNGLGTSAALASGMVSSEQRNDRTIYSVIGQRVPHPQNGNLTFAVGGAGSNAQSIIDALPDEVKGQKNSAGKYVGGQTHVIPFDDAIATGAKINSDDELLEHGYNARIAKNNEVSGQVRNHDAVRLAAHLYAHGKMEQPNGNHYGINVLAAGTGGLTAREALDIINRINPDGKAIASRIKLVTLGTPHFGLNDEDAEKRFVPETNMRGSGDTLSKMPNRGAMSVAINDVDSSSAASYLQSPTVQKEIKGIFGYSKPVSPSPKYVKKKKQAYSTKQKQTQQQQTAASTAAAAEQEAHRKEVQKQQRMAAQKARLQPFVDEYKNLNPGFNEASASPEEKQAFYEYVSKKEQTAYKKQQRINKVKKALNNN